MQKLPLAQLASFGDVVVQTRYREDRFDGLRFHSEQRKKPSQIDENGLLLLQLEPKLVPLRKDPLSILEMPRLIAYSS
jgi:hypothetical protein